MVTYATSSDEALRTATGKDWTEWLAILDKAGAQEWPHPKIATWLSDNYDFPSEWWAQQITTGYEQARKKRELYQRADGTYSASASKTLTMPLEQVFQRFADKSERDWLPVAIEITTSTPHKYLRAKGPNDTRISINFLTKSSDKTTVQVEIQKLKSSKEREEVSRMWREALSALE